MIDAHALLSRVSDLTLPKAAAAYAEAGVPVFPCAPGAKRPRTQHGLIDATTDVRSIERWWTRWPTANIGMPTGGSGFDVVDVDRRPSGSGFAAVERARRAGLIDGWAVITRTPSGGVHFYYPATPERAHRSWSVPQAHVDFRARGGYVVAPPSRVVTSAGQVAGYELLAVGRDPSPVDGEALRAFLRPRHQRPATDARPGGLVQRRLADWLAARPEGNRNRSLFWAACRCAQNGIAEDQAHELLLRAAEQAGLPRAEITATITSAYRTATPHTHSSPPGPSSSARGGLAP